MGKYFAMLKSWDETKTFQENITCLGITKSGGYQMVSKFGLSFKSCKDYWVGDIPVEASSGGSNRQGPAWDQPNFYL